MEKQQAREMWIDALQSGEYNQGRIVLHHKNSRNNKEYHCCLGVLCDLYVKHVGDLVVEFNNTSGNYFYGEKLSNGEVNNYQNELPDNVKDWVGLRSRIGMADVNGTLLEEGNSLAALNDGGYTFDEIADVIGGDDYLFVKNMKG